MTDPQSHPIDISAETDAPPRNLDLGPPPIDPPVGHPGPPGQDPIVYVPEPTSG